MSRKKRSADEEPDRGRDDDENESRSDGRIIWERFINFSRNPVVRLWLFSELWKQTENPIYVWKAIKFCARNQLGFPDWVCTYLAECAERMSSPDAGVASDVRKALPQILGFALMRGRGSALRPLGDEWKYLVPAARFALEIVRGTKPSAALRSAFDHLDAGVADKMDDKTLMSHIKQQFGIKRAPRSNAEWNGIIKAWAFSVFGPFFPKEIREFVP